MRVTCIGHAGFVIETTGGTIVCDPWFNPAYFGSWYPFPRNDGIDLTLIHNADYLYISHAHLDHLDVDFLRGNVAKTATVLLPDFGVDFLEYALRQVGFTNFLRSRNEEAIELDGELTVAVKSLAAPHVGPMGDSLLLVADPSGVVLDQNDAHPSDLDFADQFGSVDAHLLQYSGAIWYPMVYEIDDEQEASLVAAKRARQTERALGYVDMANARHVVPSAGPPCFLDEELFHLNDLPDGPPSIFPDAPHFIAELADAGNDQGRLMVPGSVLEIGGDHDGQLVHSVSDQALHEPFTNKRGYLESYQADMADVIAAEHRSWPTETTDLLTTMARWLDPILEIAKHTRAGVAASVMLSTEDGLDIVIDMAEGVVRAPHDNEHCSFRFGTRRSLLESSVQRRVEDWCNELFLSCRFSAHRDGAYNEYLYTFFKSLSMTRMAYAESFYAAQLAETDVSWVEVDGWIVERNCPHQGAALIRFGTVCENVLTCGLHGWEYDLPSGRCLNTEGVYLKVRGPVEHPADD